MACGRRSGWSWWPSRPCGPAGPQRPAAFPAGGYLARLAMFHICKSCCGGVLPFCSLCAFPPGGSLPPGGGARRGDGEHLRSAGAKAPPATGGGTTETEQVMADLKVDYALLDQSEV